MIGIRGKTNYVVRLLAGWCVCLMMLGPAASGRYVEQKQDVAFSSSHLPTVDFSDTAAQQILYRAASVKLLGCASDTASLLVLGSCAQFSRSTALAVLRDVPNVCSLLLLRTLLRL